MIENNEQAHIALSEILRKKRKKANISQIELAKKLKCNQSYISKLENARLHLEVITAIQYCNAIGIELDEIIFELKKTLNLK